MMAEGHHRLSDAKRDIRRGTKGGLPPAVKSAIIQISAFPGVSEMKWPPWAATTMGQIKKDDAAAVQSLVTALTTDAFWVGWLDGVLSHSADPAAARARYLDLYRQAYP
jgi:hypothetical protein